MVVKKASMSVAARLRRFLAMRHAPDMAWAKMKFIRQ